jgi:hypothetical protein
MGGQEGRTGMKCPCYGAAPDESGFRARAAVAAAHLGDRGEGAPWGSLVVWREDVYTGLWPPQDTTTNWDIKELDLRDQRCAWVRLAWYTARTL